MNKLQQLVKNYRDMYSAMFGTLPVSPVPENLNIVAARRLGTELKKVPGDILDGLDASIELSPPGQLVKQIVAYNSVNPEAEARRIPLENLQNLNRAKKLIVYGSLLRPFMPKRSLDTSMQAIRQNGNRWIEQPQDGYMQ